MCPPATCVCDLQAAADLLPPSAKLAHEDDLLSRHWHEPLDSPALKQVRPLLISESNSASRARLLLRNAHCMATSTALACFDPLMDAPWSLCLQALTDAVTELPCMSAGYYGPADSVVVAAFAADNVASSTTGGLCCDAL